MDAKYGSYAEAKLAQPKRPCRAVILIALQARPTDSLRRSCHWRDGGLVLPLRPLMTWRSPMTGCRVSMRGPA